MNILMLLSQLEVTGAEVYSVSKAEKLINRGHNVFIISDTLTKKTRANYLSLPLSNRNITNRIKNTLAVYRFIKKNNIHIVNAHSRASAWVSNLACKFANVPLIVFIHGRQSTFLSRRLVHGFGDYTIAVCEKLSEQLLDVFKVDPGKVEVMRNGFDIPEIGKAIYRSHKTVAFITRLSGPKKELAYKLLEHVSNSDFLSEFKNVKFKIIGGQSIPPEFDKFKNIFEFTGYTDNLPREIENADVIIGSGRVAIDAVLHKKPLVAMGEACTIGLVTKKNLRFALETNFGDMNVTEKDFDFNKITDDLKKALDLTECEDEVYLRVVNDCDIEKIVDRLEYLFQSVSVRFYRNEIPIIYYHRIAKNISDAGKHGIFVTEQQFENHLRFLKKAGYKSISFDEALNVKKSGTSGKFVMITFDDGYEDNYTLAFPLLKKYGCKALIFLVAGLESNTWDEQADEPVLKMMSENQIKEMAEYGIEFGSHTLTHADLTKLTHKEAKRELTESKKILEAKTGKEITSFAYPYGNCNETVKKTAGEAGYKFVFATDNGPMGLHEDLLQIRRIGIFPNTTVRGLARKIRGGYAFKREKKESQNLQIPR
ncbi:MAG: polysaccharide deacetylase [Ignavibacteriae bacterium HGW-Ignavibacteriae-3]|nr:MAG: polysaccharide deacetylase [Ignavibacteriae bacterium HGW-Ignavibacteriae-3]